MLKHYVNPKKVIIEYSHGECFEIDSPSIAHIDTSNQDQDQSDLEIKNTYYCEVVFLNTIESRQSTYGYRIPENLRGKINRGDLLSSIP